MANVTLFPSISDPENGADFPLTQILDFIKKGKWQLQIENLRNTNNELERAKLKKQLPNFTGSGTFKRRSKNDLVKHSGFIVMDFDKLEELEKTKAKLVKDKYTYSVFTSASGNGLACIVKIEPDNHAEAFNSLEIYYKNAHKLIADTAVKDVARTRFISYDPDLYLNQKAQTFKIQNSKKKQQTDTLLERIDNLCRKAYKGNRNTTMNKAAYLAGGLIAGDWIDESTIYNHLLYIVKSIFSPDEDIKAEIITVENAIMAGKLKPINKEYYDEEIRRSEIDVNARNELIKAIHVKNRAGNNPTDTDLQYYANLYHISYSYVLEMFRKIYKMYENEHNIDNKPPIYRVEAFLKRNYYLRRNEVTGQLFVKRLSDSDESISIESIYRDLLHKQVGKFDISNLRTLMRSDFVPTFNPIKDLFLSFRKRKIDTNRDYVKELTSFITLRNEYYREFFVEQFRKMLIRCIKQLYSDDVNRFIFVLVGEKQESGKTTFLRFLNPFTSGEYYTEESLKDDKDSQIRLSENFIYNIDELADLDKRGLEKIKSIISSFMTKQRRPYAEFEEQRPRIANFFASTNSVEFLQDIENTRWLCFEIESINFEYSKKINILDVWHQCYNDYILQYDTSLTDFEKSVRNEMNQSFVTQTNEQSLIIKYFNLLPEEDVWLTLSEIQLTLQEEVGNLYRIDNKNLKQAISQLNIQNKRIMQGKVREIRYKIRKRAVPKQ